MKCNRGEVEGLFDKRSSAEQAFLERYMAAAEAYERQLEELRCADAEDYNLLKVRCVQTPYSGSRVQAYNLLKVRCVQTPYSGSRVQAYNLLKVRCVQTPYSGSRVQAYTCGLILRQAYKPAVLCLHANLCSCAT